MHHEADKNSMNSCQLIIASVLHQFDQEDENE